MNRLFGEAALDAADLRRGDRILDSGCGNGATTLDAAARVASRGTDAGVDVSAPMLHPRPDPSRCRTPQRRVPSRRRPAAPVRRAMLRHGDRPVRDDVLRPRVPFINLLRALRPGGRLAIVCRQDISTANGSSFGRRSRRPPRPPRLRAARHSRPTLVRRSGTHTPDHRGRRIPRRPLLTPSPSPSASPKTPTTRSPSSPHSSSRLANLRPGSAAAAPNSFAWAVSCSARCAPSPSGSASHPCSGEGSAVASSRLARRNQPLATEVLP